MPSLDISILYSVDCSLLLFYYIPLSVFHQKYVFITSHGCVFFINGIGALIGAHFLADDDHLIQKKPR